MLGQTRTVLSSQHKAYRNPFVLVNHSRQLQTRNKTDTCSPASPIIWSSLISYRVISPAATRANACENRHSSRTKGTDLSSLDCSQCCIFPSPQIQPSIPIPHCHGSRVPSGEERVETIVFAGFIFPRRRHLFESHGTKTGQMTS